MQETKQRGVHVLSFDDRSTNCGTNKKATKRLRQTDGERFFEDRVHSEFVKEFHRRILAFETLTTQNGS